MRRNDEETITRLQNHINRLIHFTKVDAIQSEKHVSKTWWIISCEN